MLKGVLGFLYLICLQFFTAFLERNILPWQIKSTLIIKFSCSEMPCNAEFCVGLSAFLGIIFFLVYNYTFYKILQNGAIQSNV